jgi:hypothetical protein
MVLWSITICSKLHITLRHLFTIFCPTVQRFSRADERPLLNKSSYSKPGSLKIGAYGGFTSHRLKNPGKGQFTLKWVKASGDKNNF